MNKYLVQGGETMSRIEKFFSLTKIKSECIRDALVDHLVVGHPEKTAVALNGVDQANFNRSLSRLNEVAGTVESIKEDDWSDYRAKFIEDCGAEEHF